MKREQSKEECDTFLSKIYNFKIPYLDKMIDLGFEEIQKKLDHERAKEIHQMKIEEQNNQIKVNNSEIELNKSKIELKNNDTENHIKVNNSDIELNNSKRRYWFW